eukprot:TRINITY_DN3854_c0_g1_i1.p1 TRINITY_DN3854_c0_g1~~TRINITY_DN3854_c0_g1_i1.p1  ORF type:complete len:162 (+),score=58.15 TRINITY_DN3854_c0_g1_i1:58-486(+)
MRQNTETIAKTGEHVKQSRRIAAEIEETGAGILVNLDDQRSKLKGIREKVDETDSSISRARRLLTNMTYRAYQNKAFMYCIIVVLVVLIILIIYFKFFRWKEKRQQQLILFLFLFGFVFQLLFFCLGYEKKKQKKKKNKKKK